MIKKCIGAVSFILVLCLAMTLAPVANAQDTKSALEGFEHVSENDRLALFALRERGEAAVLDKRTGKVWYSNPPDRENDEIASGFNKQAVNSQVLIRYSDKRGVSLDMPSNLSVTLKGGMSSKISGGAIVYTYKFVKEEISIPVEYSIGEDFFKARILTSEIKEYGQNKLTYAELLPFFGAGSRSENGYIFVPDGSGALINFNNGKISAKEYSAPVYGENAATGTKSVSSSISSRTMFTKSADIRLPVFGMKNNDNGFLAVITGAAPRALIKAYVSGKSTGYNNVYTQFQYREIGSVRLIQREFSDLLSSISERKPGADTDFEVTYYFLEKGRSGYADMAARYREHLIEHEGLKGRALSSDSSGIPFYLDIYGYVNKRKSFLGIPYEATIPLTTFDDASKMVALLNDGSVKNIVVKYNNWVKNGVYKQIPTKARVESKLGGVKGLNELEKRLGENGGQVYLSVDLMNVYKTGNGFSRYSDALLSVANTPLLQTSNCLDSANIRQSFGQWYLLSPLKLDKFFGAFLNNYKRLGSENLALDTIGAKCYSSLSSDGLSRSAVPPLIKKLLDKSLETSPNLLLTGGNDYITPFASHILDTSQKSSSYDIFDEDVPFYQIVFHGTLSYSLMSANLGSNPEKMYLRCLETGASPMFSWVGRNSSELISTRMNNLYSADYTLWMDDAIESYKTINSVLSPVSGEYITAHEKLAFGVYKTTYGDKLTVTVNYNDTDARVGDITIEANGYIVGEVKQ